MRSNQQRRLLRIARVSPRPALPRCIGRCPARSPTSPPPPPRPFRPQTLASICYTEAGTNDNLKADVPKHITMLANDALNNAVTEDPAVKRELLQASAASCAALTLGCGTWHAPRTSITPPLRTPVLQLPTGWRCIIAVHIPQQHPQHKVPGRPILISAIRRRRCCAPQACVDCLQKLSLPNEGKTKVREARAIDLLAAVLAAGDEDLDLTRAAASVLMLITIEIASKFPVMKAAGETLMLLLEHPDAGEPPRRLIAPVLL